MSGSDTILGLTWLEAQNSPKLPAFVVRYRITLEESPSSRSSPNRTGQGERREGGGGSEPNKSIESHGGCSECVGGAVPRPDAPQLRLRYLCCCRRLRRRAGPIPFPHFFSSFSDAICVRSFFFFIVWTSIILMFVPLVESFPSIVVDHHLIKNYACNNW